MEEKVGWQGPEHFHIEKTLDWYWAVGIISLASAVAAVLLNNFIFAILIVLAAFTLMMIASRTPRTVEMEVNDSGIVFGEFYYPYKSLESYDIEQVPELRILIKTKRLWMPVVIIPAHDADTEKIGKILSKHLKFEDLKESVAHKIFEYLGF
jgi:uncharacterized membrane protein YobD (UPF0266 family)